MSDADCTPGREPHSVAASLIPYVFTWRPVVWNTWKVMELQCWGNVRELMKSRKGWENVLILEKCDWKLLTVGFASQCRHLINSDKATTSKQ